MRGIDVHEGRARAETDEQEPVAGGCALSVEIDDGVATALARTEQERIIARAAGQLVDATAAVEQVGPAIAVELVVEAVAVALQVGGALQHQRFYVRRQRKMGSRKYRVVALAGALEHGVAGIVDEIGVVADATLLLKLMPPVPNRILPKAATSIVPRAAEMATL